uniref:RNA helicase n=1 Tax=Astyanax mexicanus TaxID=7994 RepID=A0A8B9LU40_ASTMX
MLEISIIKVVDPGCLWGKVVKGPGMQAENPREYEDLQTKMNLFYHDVNLEVQEIKPTTLEEGQLCAVFCPVLKSWCRATVESLFVGTVGSQAMCFLVDHGERFIINTDDVRALLEKFLQLPFRVRRFQLARIYPMRLKVSISTETAELVPSPCWDVSATKYLHNLLKVSTLVEAVLCETNADCTAVELYLTIRNVKICVNDDLVVKKFACYSSEKAITEEQNESLDRSLVSLAWDMFSRPQQILEMNGCCTVRSHFPRVVHSTSNDTSTELKETDFSQESNAKDQLSCARLLQLLNPDPLNLDTECIEDNVSIVCYEPSRRGVLVHSAVTVNPCSNLSLAPITEQFRKFLLRRKYNGPGLAESYAWPSVARGCDTVLVVHGGNDPLTYIPPLLAQLQMASVFSALNTRKGPIAVILCPGWEKVQYVLDLLEDSQAAASLHPAAVLLGLKKDEAKNAKIQKNCQLLVTTPFSLARLLEVHCFLFLRLCHLVLDEVSELYSRAPDQVSTILKHFREVAREKSLECSQQIVAVSNQWSRELDGLITEHMVSPCVVVTVPEEAAVYGGVLQTVLLCLDCNKTSVMLSSLDFSPSVPQKTLIVTNSVEEVEHVYKAVSNTAAFSLKAHEGLSYQFDFVVEQWKKDIGSGTQVILVTTNDSMKALGIRDATCVVHYGFPGSPKLFGNRLFCMSDNFQNQSSSPVVRSVMLLSERNARHVSGVLRYLKRTCATLPPELLQFSEGVQQAKEEQKIGRALCSHLKSLGFCRWESAVCPDRHIINRTLDHPLHPDSGTIQVLPLYIKSANVYYGRIVSQKQDQFKDLAAEMNSHYTEERVFAKDVVKGGLYAVHEEEEYHRVCVTKVPDKEDKLFSSVTAHFIDDGYVQEVKSHQLLQLPSEFQSLPGQAVEIILCRVQPIDGEMDWNPKVTRAISLKIKGKLHQAKLIKCLGSTVWVDPMIRVTRVPGLSSFINEYNVHDEIIATGMGTINSQHLELLKTLCFGEEASAAVVPSESERLFLCSVDKLTANYHSADICEPSEVMKNIRPTQITVPNGGSKELMFGIVVASYYFFAHFSFHPQIKWFQREESVTLKVKLVNPMMQKCEFFSDRVLYSSYVRSRRYCADLELHSDIRTEQCKWEMKCNEPEITLVKKEKGLWKSLLKCKACVSFYIQHNCSFLASTGEVGIYTNSGSGSDSD